MEPNAALMVYTLAKDSIGALRIVRGAVPVVDAASVTDSDYSREITLAEKTLADMGYTTFGSFTEHDQAARVVDLPSCEEVYCAMVGHGGLDRMGNLDSLRLRSGPAT